MLVRSLPMDNYIPYSFFPEDLINRMKEERKKDFEQKQVKECSMLIRLPLFLTYSLSNHIRKSLKK